MSSPPDVRSSTSEGLVSIREEGAHDSETTRKTGASWLEKSGKKTTRELEINENKKCWSDGASYKYQRG